MVEFDEEFRHLFYSDFADFTTGLNETHQRLLPLKARSIPLRSPRRVLDDSSRTFRR